MHLNFRLISLVFIVLVSASLLMSAMSYRQFEAVLEPAIEQKTSALASSIEHEIGRALNFGVPLDGLNGLDEYFEPIVQGNPEIYGIRLTTHKNHVDSRGFSEAINRSDVMRSEYPVVHQGIDIATLTFLLDKNFVEKKSLELLLDLLTVIVVSVIIAFELVVFIVGFNITTRIQQIAVATRDFLAHKRLQLVENYYTDELDLFTREINTRLREVSARCHIPLLTSEASIIQRVEFIRWPFFLLVFSESLSLSFFPTYVGQLHVPDWGLSREFVVGFPISLFMFIWAVSMPAGGVWSDTVGRRRSFIAGAVLATIGLTLTAFTYSLFDLLVWRSLTAIGYGIVFITAQGFITDNTDQSNRNKGMATFVATFFAGSLSGSAIGGILADHISMPLIFVMSAVLSLGSALFVARFITGTISQKRPKMTLASIKQVCLDRSFLMVTLFSAIPSKVALTGFLYFSAPLFLSALEASKSTTGRVIMLYGLIIICLSPVIASFADRLKSRLTLIVSGGIVGAMAIGTLAISPSLEGLIISISLLGIAHAVAVPSQLTFITETNQDLCNRLGVGQVVGIFRLIERLGNILGPLIFGLVISVTGITNAFLWVSILIGSATLVLTIWVIRHRPERSA